MTPLALYHHTMGSLTAFGIPEPEAEAALLVCHILDCRRADIFLDRGARVADSARDVVEQALSRRQNREPLAYILGEQDFYGRTFAVTQDVLIPRPETELLVERAIAALHDMSPPDRPRILDLGTGSGIIAITLLLEVPEAMAVALELSRPALRVAQANAGRHGVTSRVDWLNASWSTALRDGVGFTLVAANPPYVAGKIGDSLQPELKSEPALALYGGENGCRDIDWIMADAYRLLCPGGALFMEIGFDQGEYVLDRMRNIGQYDQIAVHSDYAGPAQNPHGSPADRIGEDSSRWVCLVVPAAALAEEPYPGRRGGAGLSSSPPYCPAIFSHATGWKCA